MKGRVLVGIVSNFANGDANPLSALCLERDNKGDAVCVVCSQSYCSLTRSNKESREARKMDLSTKREKAVKFVGVKDTLMRRRDEDERTS